MSSLDLFAAAAAKAAKADEDIIAADEAQAEAEETEAAGLRHHNHGHHQHHMPSPPPPSSSAAAAGFFAEEDLPQSRPLPPGIVAAYRDAKARGLPGGWTCTIDKRHRRKWTAPDGRSCDSIPKALAISVELGLLPPDTEIVAGPAKRKKKKQSQSQPSNHHQSTSAGSGSSSMKRQRTGDDDDDVDGDGEDDKEEGGEDAADPTHKKPKKRVRKPKAEFGAQETAAAAVSPATTSGRAATSAASSALKDASSSSGSATAASKSGSTKTAAAADATAKKKKKAKGKLDAIVEEEPEEEEEEEEEVDDEEILRHPPSEEMDPERSLDVLGGRNKKTREAPPTTVHWDPSGPDGSRIGWKVKMAVTAAQAAAVGCSKRAVVAKPISPGDDRTHWIEGRIVDYDPYTHKHKIDFAPTPQLLYSSQQSTAATASSTQQQESGRKKRGPKPKHGGTSATAASSSSKSGKNTSCWIWLRNREHQLTVATRMVWAHVKGYAWWPALVMESNQDTSGLHGGHHPAHSTGGGGGGARPSKNKDGYVLVEFFGSGEVSTLRDTTDCVRPFCPHEMDPVVARHKKKRNAAAFATAWEEYDAITRCRREAALSYAHRALDMVQVAAVTGRAGAGAGDSGGWVGRRVEIHRTDVNYPYGDTLTAKVRKYSTVQKKWLLSYDISDKTRYKYDASWINLEGKKDCSSVKMLTKGSVVEREQEDLVPYLVGYEYTAPEEEDGDGASTGGDGPAAGSKSPPTPTSNEETTNMSPRDAELVQLLSKHCRGCVEYFKTDDIRMECDECGADYHIGCTDPALTIEAWQKLLKDETPFVCSRCIPCRGCYRKDAVFGSHPYSCPPTLSFPKGEALNLCSMCTAAYNDCCFCPNCAHSWDNDKYQLVTQQLDYAGAAMRKRLADGVKDNTICDTVFPPVLGSFSGEDVLPPGAMVDPSYFYPETSEWGFGEDHMLVCDSCDAWVHAGCSNMDEEEYELTSDEKHPIYSKEFLCRVCCRQRCKEIIRALEYQDAKMLFAVPVTEKMAPNYHDVIKNPMDLQTMLERAETDEYPNYAWVRELFELMVLNALTFNRFYTGVWNEAKRYYQDCLETVFKTVGKAAPPGKYASAIEENFKSALAAVKMEADRVQVDESVEKKDLVAGSMAASVALPKLRDNPPDQASCVQFTELRLKPTDAFYCAWMDCCYICGSSGAMDTMVFCVDCGEAFHAFCANVPVHSMDEFGVAGWRCPNCKICEISGDVPRDETRMLVCDMCDRGFNLDLLDPPLESAPPGLWICGQCVDCKVCVNSAEEVGASLKHWSRDPEKCFRCGGCEGLVDDSFQCTVCTKLLRLSDGNIVRCSKCSGALHADCHYTAKEYLLKLTGLSRGEPEDDYYCPTCIPPPEDTGGDPVAERKGLSEMAWALITRGDLPPHENCSDEELHTKLVEETDWRVRDLWREEYLSVIREGLRIYALAATSFGDSRIIVQHALSGCNLPMFTIQRALRFVFIVRRHKWDTGEFSPDRIESIVHSAKLASAFLDVAHAVLRVEIDPIIRTSERLHALLQGPDEIGNSVFPSERIRITEGMDVNAQAAVQAKEEKVKSSNREAVPANIAAPLCGWSGLPNVPQRNFDWKDPRECCLCHMCGDDDAGLPCSPDSDVDAESPDLRNLGRLLPMSDGLFVHTSCALWSSEVWEDARDGLIHAVDKARCRGSQLKCFGCGFYGATCGCNKSNCLFNYHFPCAKACGAAFTTDQHVFCSNHKSCATETLKRVSFEHMKALMVAPEKDKKTTAIEKDPSDAGGEPDLCLRAGSVVVHSIGAIPGNCDGFHSENYITPPGYVATRIFWSSIRPRSRTVYVLKIDRSVDGSGPEYTILPGDAPGSKITGSSVSLVYSTLLDRVRKVNSDSFSQGDPLSKQPVVRRTRRKTFGLNGPQFFGFGLDHVRKVLETSPGVEAVVAPLTGSSPQYRFCFHQPSIESIKGLIRNRAAAKHERSLENASGCARTEGMKAVTQSGGSGRITRVLVRRVEEENAESSAASKRGEDMAKAARSVQQVKYKRMKSVPMEQRLVAWRSHIHGWGLFTKIEIAKDDPIVEYMGETIRQPVADKRERGYEISGEGSCYMFRLDRLRIVDATMIGCMARFMNHSCQPNAYAKIISVDTGTEAGQERKIVVFANRDIPTGTEITYDYKFPVEDGSLRCTCGAPGCIGRLN